MLRDDYGHPIGRGSVAVGCRIELRSRGGYGPAIYVQVTRADLDASLASDGASVDVQLGISGDIRAVAVGGYDRTIMDVDDGEVVGRRDGSVDIYAMDALS